MFLVVATVCVPVCTCVWLASRRQRPRTYVPNAVAVLRHTGQLLRQRIVGPTSQWGHDEDPAPAADRCQSRGRSQAALQEPRLPSDGQWRIVPGILLDRMPFLHPRRPEGSPRKAGSTFDALRPAQGTPHSPHRSCGRQGSGARVGETRENGGRKGWRETATPNSRCFHDNRRGRESRIEDSGPIGGKQFLDQDDCHASEVSRHQSGLLPICYA